MKTLTYQKVRYTRDELEHKLNEACEQRVRLEEGLTTPKQLIGTGYRSPKLRAHEYVSEQIGRWSALLTALDEMEER
tara:strand:- start:298 stop:528 length:231 start_codon:yes stop_codon:yes gene_type:complete